MNKRKSVYDYEDSISSASNPQRKINKCCRNFVAFMCTQVGVGALIVVYAICGALSFVAIETQNQDNSMELVHNLRKNCSTELWSKTESLNLFNRSVWEMETNEILRYYQNNITSLIRKGYTGRTAQDIWSFPAALMFCLSVFTMIGYGNMVPRTPWGKGFTVIYATFGIPLYILYFLNMGKVLANSFRFLYRVMHGCTDDNPVSPLHKKKVIVPSTACLWVIFIYILTGTVMFANWEDWTYLNSIYFCITSLCKIGFGDFVPGANLVLLASNAKDQTKRNFYEMQSQTKLAINFIYMLVGMGLVAMCYNLMREEVRVKWMEMREDLKLCLEDVRKRFDRWFGHSSSDDFFDYDRRY